MAAFLLSLAGVSDDVIAEDLVVSNAYLQPLYEEWLADETDPVVRAKRSSHGSLEGYVLAGGISADQIDQIRRRLL